MLKIKLIAVYSREYKEVGGLTTKGQEGIWGTTKNILDTGWGSGYMVCTFARTHETEYFECFHLFYENYTFIKVIKNHKMR